MHNGLGGGGLSAVPGAFLRGVLQLPGQRGRGGGASSGQLLACVPFLTTCSVVCRGPAPAWGAEHLEVNGDRFQTLKSCRLVR